MSELFETTPKSILKYAFFTSTLALLLLVAASVYAVEPFKVSSYGGGHQIWFEAEAFDERIPDGDAHYQIAGEEGAREAPEGAYGGAIVQTGVPGGTIVYRFDISRADGAAGTWYFWGRVFNPSNMSDYLLVSGDPGDEPLPEGPPFPGGINVPPFDNRDDQIFEEDVLQWGWSSQAAGPQLMSKELKNGENTMYIFQRQGDSSVFWDVFMWSDAAKYVPTDDDYTNAEEIEISEAVSPVLKLATSWGMIKGE